MVDPRLARPLWRGRTNVDAYTIAWIEHAEQIKADRWPKRPELHHKYAVTQGGYQGTAGDPDSGTTHRLGGGTDFHWCGHPECLLALRLAGGFVWLRNPAQGDWPFHMHGGPLDHPYMDTRLAAQQVSYLSRGNGLGGPDDGPRLDPIPRPVWPWPQEDDMPFTNWPKEDQDALVDRIANAVTKRLLDTDLTPKQDEPRSSVRAALNKVLRLGDKDAGHRR
ncbi:hypothetical protein [Nocardioides sp. SR21]|uniref:hypothetical protein n=1 Tax=Nocardioides sp. SR21 TaxID=2919501 RepID=UPI001FAA5A42|nr:hypothetical protein [Nocardioides sp. SR21]